MSFDLPGRVSLPAGMQSIRRGKWVLAIVANMVWAAPVVFGVLCVVSFKVRYWAKLHVYHREYLAWKKDGGQMMILIGAWRLPQAERGLNGSKDDLLRGE